MHKVAILLDGGHVLFELTEGKIKTDSSVLPTAEQVEKLAHACYKRKEEDLFRIYYYDCRPFAGAPYHPIAKRKFDYGQGETYQRRDRLYRELAQTKNFAFRSGQLKFRGWRLKKSALKKLMADPVPLGEEHLRADFQQKGVDIKIGLDISWLASKRIVDRIILFTGDTDFIPAMKFARREGVQVVLAALRDKVNSALKEHSDEFRLIEWP